MTNKKNIKFTLLDPDERASKLRQMGYLHIEVKVWEKGKADLFSVIALHGVDGRLEVERSSESNINKIIKNKILFNANLRGLEVFGSGKFEIKNDKLYLVPSTDFYKCERRKNYRLVTYFNHEAVINLKLDKIQIEEQNKVLDFDRNRLGDQTKLFKDFLKLVNQDGGRIHYEDKGDSFEVSYRVFDVSATGVAFKIGEYEKNWFEKDKVISPFVIVFDDVEYNISGGKVVYVVDFVDPDRRGVNLYKVGLEFSEIPHELYAKLTRQINKELQEMRSSKEFEDFLE